MEKYLEHLAQANRSFQIADHIIYITYPLLKDKNLIFKIIEQLNQSIFNLISAILQYEYLYKRIKLGSDKKENMERFMNICASRYNINEQEKQTIKKILELFNKHKQSPLEFAKNNKIVIMSDNLHTETITIEQMKEFIIIIKTILQKINTKIQQRL